MSKERNKAIGEVECAHKGCDRRASIFKFRPAGKNPNAWARRHAGKLYSRCEDGHECRDQEYLLKGKLWGPSEAKAGGEGEPVKVEQQSEPPAQQTPPVQQSSVPPRQQPKSKSGSASTQRKSGFGFFKFGKAEQQGT